MISDESELDKKLVQTILKKGFSRIPVFKGDRENIVGMIMVKNLLEVEFSEKILVKNLKLSNIPKFSQDHSLFATFNEFKQGRSHMGIVESLIGGVRKPIGIVTMEDLIEELLQQEIIDETDEKLPEARTVPLQATLQGYLMHSMKSATEMSGKSEKIGPRDEGNVSELLLDNKRV
jgi:CBS domain containing-hemolysin-like protein